MIKKGWVLLLDLLLVGLVAGGYWLIGSQINPPKVGQAAKSAVKKPVAVKKPPKKQFSLAPTEYHSQSILVYDLTEKRAIYQKAADTKVHPASLVKVMTAMVVLDNIDDLEQQTGISQTALNQMKTKGAALSGLPIGRLMTVKGLLYGSLLPSGGDATVALAQLVEKQTGQKFVDLMNQKAAALGMKDTSFTNAVGFDNEAQLTTAQDLVKLFEYALANQDFYQIFTTKIIDLLINDQKITLESTVLSKLEPTISDFAILGGKSGTTAEAGLCWATLVEKNEHKLLILTLGAKFDDWNNLPDYQKQDLIKILGGLEYK